MATYIRHATRAQKHVIKLVDAHDRGKVAENVVAVTVLEKPDATFSLTFVFPDETELVLTNDEVLNGDVFAWDVSAVLITNTAQAGKTLKLVVDQQLLPGT